MIRYETLMLAPTSITDDELGRIEKQFEALTAKAQGALDSFDKWGKYRLAYPIKKDEYGIYVLARFQAPKEAITALNKDIGTFFKIKCHEFIIRHVTARLEDDAPISYLKPEPIDAKGTSNFDSFIKENKIEGILKTKVEASASTKTSAPKAVQKEVREVEQQEPTLVKSEESAAEETATTEEQAGTEETAAAAATDESTQSS